MLSSTTPLLTRFRFWYSLFSEVRHQWWRSCFCYPPVSSSWNVMYGVIQLNRWKILWVLLVCAWSEFKQFHALFIIAEGNCGFGCSTRLQIATFDDGPLEVHPAANITHDHSTQRISKWMVQLRRSIPNHYGIIRRSVFDCVPFCNISAEILIWPLTVLYKWNDIANTKFQMVAWKQLRKTRQKCTMIMS